MEKVLFGYFFNFFNFFLVWVELSFLFGEVGRGVTNERKNKTFLVTILGKTILIFFLFEKDLQMSKKMRVSFLKEGGKKQ